VICWRSSEYDRIESPNPARVMFEPRGDVAVGPRISLWMRQGDVWGDVDSEDEMGLGHVVLVPIPSRSDVQTIPRCRFQTAADREPSGGVTRL